MSQPDVRGDHWPDDHTHEARRLYAQESSTRRVEPSERPRGWSDQGPTFQALYSGLRARYLAPHMTGLDEAV